MDKALSFSALSLFFTAGVIAQDYTSYGNPIPTGCHYSFYSDSYGRGIGSVFLHKTIRATYHDGVCFELGVEAAKNALSTEGDSCKVEFLEGYDHGQVASPNSAGLPCYVLGYTAGRGILGTGAREAIVAEVGLECVDAYKRGVKEVSEGRAYGPNTFDFKLSYCYQLGVFDGGI